MRKILSISLAVVMLISVLSVLMILPATAIETATGPVNLIVNGDANGVDTDGDGELDKQIYTADDAAASTYTGEFDKGAPVGWRDLNETYANAKNFYPHTFGHVPSGYYSNYSKTLVLGLNQGQTLVQDIVLEAGKSYKVSAKIAANVINVDTQTGKVVNMFIDGKSGMTAATAPKNVDWLATKTFTFEATGYDYDADGVTVTKTYYSAGDFTDHSFTFNADEWATANGVTAVDGKYSARLVFQSTVYGNAYTMYDDVTMYEVATLEAADGGYIKGATDCLVGENIVSAAIPYYGNTFAGWYDAKGNLVSTDPFINGTVAQSLTAKFNSYNVVTDGNFESGTGAGETFINAESHCANGGKNVVIENPTGSAAQGKYVLKANPATAANTNCDLITIPFTAKKNTQYVMHLSYYAVDTAQTGYVGLHSRNSFTNGWTKGTFVPDYTYHWEVAGITNKAAWTVCGGVNGNYGMMRDQVHATVGSGANKWIDFWVTFNPAESATVFADGEDTAEMFFLFGLDNSNTNTYYVDNISITEAKETANTAINAVAGANGKVAVADAFVPDSVYYAETGGKKVGSAANALDGTVRYSQVAAYTYTATPNDGYKFVGWYDANDQLVSADKTATFYAEGTYTAKFAETPVYKVNASVDVVDGIYGGYLTGDTSFTVPEGESITVTANTYVGNTFDGWYDGDTKLSSNPVFTYTPDKATDLVAKYNINNRWPDSGYENTPLNAGLLLDKALGGDTTYAKWYSHQVSRWWSGKVTDVKVAEGSHAAAITHRNNTLDHDVTVEKNTDYVFSFDWQIQSATNGTGVSFLKSVCVYSEDGTYLATQDFGTEYSADFQNSKVVFNSGDNEKVTVAILYYAGSGAIYLDNLCVAPGSLGSEFVTITYDSGYADIGSFTEWAPVDGEYTIRGMEYLPVGKVFQGWTDGNNTYAAKSTVVAGASLNLTATYKDFESAAFSDTSSYNPEDYDYSFIVLPDEQNVAAYYPTYYSEITQWIVDNKETYNIQGVMSVGDVTNSAIYNEWSVAYDAYKLLEDAGIPFVMAPGNHDYDGGTSKGAYDPVVERKVTYFDLFFNKDTIDYTNYTTCEEVTGDSLVNAYYTVETADGPYLIMALEIFPRDSVLAWASEVLEAHSDHKAIVVTHAHLNSEGQFMEDTASGKDYYPLNNREDSNGSQEVWDEFVSQHENLLFYICGHSSNDLTLDLPMEGVHGNTVHQLLIDSQDADKNYEGVGNVVIMGFKDGGEIAGFTTYATLQDKYFFKEHNEFEIDFTPTPAEPTVPGEFEEGEDISDLVSVGSGSAATTDSYTAEDKLVNGYDETTMGDGYLKVTANGTNAGYLDVGFPVELVKGEKYLAHFKLRVLSILGTDRFDVRIDTKAASWSGCPEGLAGKVYASFSYGSLYSRAQTPEIFGGWNSQGYNSKGYVDFYMVLDATDLAAETQT
ncbi:MAG: metallophosphoesterase, partial [Clostridia bacterium]|nr:metallophosphoesterase [Clostridia bacterium]